MKIRKVTSLILALVLAMSMAFSVVGASAAGNPDILVGVYPRTAVQEWDPAATYGGDGFTLFNMYETLLRYNSFTQEFEPELATDYKVNEDGLVWTFYLREGVKFHDGSDFTAADVKYSIERTRDMGKGAAFFWNQLDVINVIDDYTCEFVLKTPFDVAEAVSCQYAAYIYSDSLGLDNDAMADWFHECQECGTGPYMLKSYDASVCVLTAFEDYWRGWDGDHFKQIVLQMVTESSTRRQMLVTGAADTTTHLTATDTLALLEEKNLSVNIEAVNQNDIIFYNLRHGPMQDINARKAVSFAYPFNDVAEFVKQGHFGRVPVDVGGMSTLRGATESMPYHYDLEVAKEYLAKSAYPDGFEMEVVYQTEIEDNKKAVELWKSELAKIGVELTITPMAAAAAESRQKSVDFADRADAYIVDQWSDTPTTSGIWSSIAVKDASWNFTGYENAELEAKLAEATINMAIDPEKGVEQLKEIGAMAAEDCFCLNTCDKSGALIVASDIAGATRDPAYTNVVRFYDCYRVK